MTTVEGSKLSFANSLKRFGLYAARSVNADLKMLPF
jgi:hypothetical protein